MAAVTNNSNGTAQITTGSADALGNDATSEGGGTVINRGDASAASGANGAVGNSSGNTALNSQFAAGGTALNSAAVTNHSTGTALIDTGAADAMGNRAVTTISQEDEGIDDLVTPIDQDHRGHQSGQCARRNRRQ